MTDKPNITTDEAIENLKKSLSNFGNTMQEGFSEMHRLVFKTVCDERDAALDRVKELEAEVIALKANQRPTSLREVKACTCARNK